MGVLLKTIIISGVRIDQHREELHWGCQQSKFSFVYFMDSLSLTTV